MFLNVMLFKLSRVIFNFILGYLLHSGKSALAITDHVAKAPPVSVHILIVGSFGRRAPLQEYWIEAPARYCVVRASAGMVTALV